MWDEKHWEQELHLPPAALIGLDEFQLAIPGRVGLHQSPEGVKKSKHFGSELFWAGYVET
jgi:hypothetical protein